MLDIKPFLKHGVGSQTEENENASKNNIREEEKQIF